ncbi:HAD family hydrolase [Alisedimentitalea sp. MJ-SS2]|uniref:sulfotransferase-like domain-containing protein n=1 Tax=Aliisedimentitalea sp. MJ-SS2 TaxID=3049795 RepID=UPI002912BA91|nr:HAD family hydrolase [Alisedimentitalea sp. MJ-SS2]MDU8927904.1 HAD family hydrolase [Alisedimentitalea sp. MJ-SS2]
MRIAMWSGPRNLSTAMMYSFGARGDCAVVDEPFYAAYLDMTGLDHPMRDEILASQSKDPKEVEKALLGSNPDGKEHFYQKHMTQHMIEGVPRDWMRDVVNVFLIRHPARVIASYVAKRENPTLEDIGFAQQAELYDQFGGVVIDSHDIRDDPEGMLRKLCDAIGLDWEAGMLSWPTGGHKDDGVWAKHWYGAVWSSTGFAGAEGPLPEVPNELRPVLGAALPHYEKMKAVKL